MMDNITVQVSGYRQGMTAIAAPSNVVLQGGSDIYVVKSINAQTDNLQQTIALSEDDKETLDKLLSSGTRTAVIMDSNGNLSVRYSFLTAGMLLIVFLAPNGEGQTYVVGYRYQNNICECITKYKLADMGEGDTMLTADNWTNYITLSSSWVKTTDMSDINLYNAKELYVLFYIEGSIFMMYIVCPDGLGANPNRTYYILNYYNYSVDANTVSYDGSRLDLSGSYERSEVYYRL